MEDIASNVIEKLRGRFVVFDGPDGAGKTTQFRRMITLAQNAGVQVCEVREPGGTNIGEQIRDILLDPENQEMDITCEMLLYMASRSQLVSQRVGPARKAGQLVIADRFISSTLAYQGTAGGLANNDILRVGKIALGAHWPDLVIIFDVDEKTAASRLNPLLDRMELKGSEFQRIVRQGFLQQAKDDPGRYLVVDASYDADHVFEQVLVGIDRKIRTASQGDL